MVPSLLLTCQEGANISNSGELSKGRPTPSRSLVERNADPTGGSAKQGSGAAFGPVPRETNQRERRVNPGLAKQLPSAATGGRCLQRVFHHPERHCSGGGFQPEFPIHSISRAFENHEAPSEILTNRDILSFRQRNN